MNPPPCLALIARHDWSSSQDGSRTDGLGERTRRRRADIIRREFVKISLIPPRDAPPVTLLPDGQQPAGPAVAGTTAPSLPATTRAVPARPASVSALSWELLAMHVEDAQRRSSIAYAPLRVVVRTVVRELRVAGESWEHVYAVLHSAVPATTGGPTRFAAEYEMHTSRSGALVAHMHSWADVERLAELEDGTPD